MTDPVTANPPAMDCPACKKPAIRAQAHRCHECRTEYPDDHDSWCGAEVCTDTNCEDWLFYPAEFDCPHCRIRLAVEIDDNWYAEIVRRREEAEDE